MSIIAPRFKVRPEIRRARHNSECSSSSSDVPLQFTNSAYMNDWENGDRSDSTSQIVMPSRLEKLQMDGLCQNTLENISIAGNLDNFEERSDSTGSLRGGRRTCSRRTAISILLCMFSVSLVCSLMCACFYSKECNFFQQNGSGDLSRMRGDDVQKWINSFQVNISRKFETQSQNFKKLQDDFSTLKERLENREEQYQKLIEENKKLEAKLNVLENLTTQIDAKTHKLEIKLNRSSDEAKHRSHNVGMQINAIATKLTNSTEILKTTLMSTKDKVFIKINDVKDYFWRALNRTVINLNNLVNNLSDYYKDLNSKFVVQESKIYNLTKIQNKARKDLEENQTKIAEDVLKMGRAVQVFMITLNDTNEDLNTTRSTLRNEMHRIQTDVLNKIQNVSKMEGPRGPMGFNGSRGPPGLQGPQGVQGPPGFNGTNTSCPGIMNAADFSMCHYRNKSEDSTAGSNASAFVTLGEPKDKRIIGATCSSNFAKYHKFEKLNHKGSTMYKCTCKGQSSLFSKQNSNSTKLICYIHYWECPIVT